MLGPVVSALALGPSFGTELDKRPELFGIGEPGAPDLGASEAAF